MASLKKFNGTTWDNATIRKMGTATEIITPPITIYTDGTAITNYTIKGNNSVGVNGVGERTENLYDINAKDVNNGYVNDAQLNQDGTTSTWGSAEISEYIAISEDTTYTFNGIGSYNALYYALYDENKQLIGTYRYNGRSTINFTSPNNARYFRFTHIKTYTQAMMVEGEYTSQTMPAYEPYGIKIPISSAGQTTPVYLGEVQTVRKIKKLVFDGTENWRQSANGAMYLSPFTGKSYKKEVAITSMNSHFAVQINTTSGTNQVEDNSSCFFVALGSAEYYIGARSYATAADFKSYLAQQYANGTPVTIWYVLANEETGIINEPLMKIGDYADTLSNAASIPTTEGANSITVDTTVQPSEFTATWTGWHNASVKEAKHGNNLFDYTTMSVSDENSYLNSDGTIGTSNDWNITDYIPCDGTSFTVGNIGGNTPAICLYDANKEYITGKSYNTGGTYSKQAVNITSQTTAKFIRFSYCKGELNPDDISTIMLNSGSSLLPYEPYSIHWE